MGEQTTEIKEKCKASYLANNEAVKRMVPAGQLLLWGPWDGWAPLCEFLGVSECPINEPFPHRDFNHFNTNVEQTDSDKVIEQELPDDLARHRLLSLLITLAIILGLCLLLCCCYRC